MLWKQGTATSAGTDMCCNEVTKYKKEVTNNQTKPAIDQRKLDVSTCISNVSCNDMCVSVCPSVRLSVGLSTYFLSGCADVLFRDADLERFFDLPRLYTCTAVRCTVVKKKKTLVWYKKKKYMYTYTSGVGVYSQFRVMRVGDFALNPRSLSYF